MDSNKEEKIEAIFKGEESKEKQHQARRIWSKIVISFNRRLQEDEALMKAVIANGSNWVIASEILRKNVASDKTCKQCRERYCFLRNLLYGLII